MPAKRLKNFLDSHNINYATIAHSTAYTSQEIASQVHIRGDELAKTVIVKIDGKMAMAVLPAPYHVDLALLKTAAKGRKIALASETDFRDSFPDCEAGATPPFGQFYGMRVFVDKTLARDKEIAFNAGTHHELIRMSYDDFAKVVQPEVANFSTMAESALRL